MANKYVAFISYRHAELDSAIAKTLHSLIEQYRIPRGIRKDSANRLGVVFRDQEELHAASDLSNEIQSALNSTEYLIVICSKNSVESPWVTREVDHFLQNHDRSQVLTVLASGEPMEVFPPQLTRTSEGDPIEPLAVDVRADSISASRKKLRRELPRLIAAILRCPYDALVMREHRRKVRRITAIAAGIMAILLCFTSTVLLKNQQIALANDQLEVKNTELNQANVALEAQKAEVQLRESQLLVQSALEDLENADYYSAIEKAVDALPKDETDKRPYYAPAESVLLDAMRIFGAAASEADLNTIQFPHLANVREFLVSQDGTRLVSVDTFGTVTCFDVQTQQQLWYQYAAPDDSLSGAENLHLFFSADGTAVLRSTKNQLAAYDLQTGEILWEETSLTFVADYVYYNAQRDTLVTVTSGFTPEFDTEYRLLEIEAATGKVRNDLYLTTAPLFSLYTFAYSGAAARTPSAGVFSAEGDQFMGTYLDAENRLNCFKADLALGSLEIFYTHPESDLHLSEVCGVQLLDSVRMVVMLRTTSVDEEISLLQLNLQTGEPVWQVEPESHNIPFASYSVSPHMLYLRDMLIVGYCDQFTLLDPRTGAVVHQKPINGLLTNLTQLSEYNFAFAVDSGAYGMGWINTDTTLTLTTDANLMTYANLEPHSQLQVWGKGIVQLDVSNDSVHLAIGNHVAPGFVALVPSQEKNVIQIVRPVEPLNPLAYTPVKLFQKNMNAASDCVAYQIGDYLLLGPFYEPSSYGNYTYAVLDPATGEVADTFAPEGYYDSNELFWLPDSMTPLKSTYSDGITLFHSDGTETVLYDPEAEQDAFAEKDGHWSSYALFRSTSTYLSDRKTLLSAATTTKQLRLWTDCASEVQVDLPEYLTISPEESSNYDRLMVAGANGWVLTSLHPVDKPVSLSAIALYDTNQSKWLSPEGTATITGGNAIAFAQSAAKMAFIDSDGNVQLMDLSTGKVLSRFSTQISAESVLNMRFFLDDTCLAVKTVGGYLQLYRISTGERLYYTQMNDGYAAYLQIFEDPQNHRLYIHGGNRSGICLDMDSWVSFGDVKNLLYYHETSGVLYQTNRVSDTDPVSCAKIPGTMQLVELAQTALANP